MRRKILILYTNYGTGHYMAAKAIKEYIDNNYLDYDVEIFDPLTFSRPTINRLFAKIGTIVATKFRKFRGKLYGKKMYKNYLKNSWFFKFCIKLFWTKKLEKYLLDSKPDVIISTQVGPTGLIAAKKKLFSAPLISVFTDYGLHRMYTVAHEFIDIFCVPNKEIQKQMVELGIEHNKIIVTGIPVHEKFLKNSNPFVKSNIIKKYKLLSDKPLFLFVCGGGLGYDNAFSYFEKLLQFDYDFSYIFISGKSKPLLEKAKKLANKYNKVGCVLGYVENMDEFIVSSDIIFGKPGGILTSEALNLGVPFCAIEPIPGQETNNALFISNNDFGFYITDMRDFLAFLNRIKSNEINFDDYKSNINNNFSKFSFIDIEKF